jgi:hypothetical protein
MDGSPIDRPEFAADADPHVVAQAIRERGVALVRGALDPSALTSLDGFTADKQEGYLVRNFTPAEITTVRDIIEPIMPIAACWFGTPAFANLARSRLRCALPVVSEGCNVGLHSDSWGHRWGGMLVLYAPLRTYGPDAPGLTVICDPNIGNWTPPGYLMPEGGYCSPHERETALRNHYGPDAFWTPHLMQGDTLLFSHYTYHGVHRHLGMTEARTSLEVRIVRSEAEDDRKFGFLYDPQASSKIS